MAEAGGLVGIPSPVPQARKDCKHLMVYAPPVMPWFEPDRIRDIIQRIRRYVSKKTLTKRERHADLITILAYTGVRSGECSRVRVQDVDFERRLMQIRMARVKSRPRAVPLRGQALDAARRSVAGRERHEVLVTTRELDAMFEKWRERLNEPDLNGRALRHSYATGLLLTGATPRCQKGSCRMNPPRDPRPDRAQPKLDRDSRIPTLPGEPSLNSR